MAIYAYDFTSGDLRTRFEYLKQFMSLLVKDLTNPKTLDFFASVTAEKKSKTYSTGRTYEDWHVYCNGVDPTVPIIDYYIMNITEDPNGGRQPGIDFNGTSLWEYWYSKLTSSDAPDDWQTNYEKYYSFDAEHDVYIQRTDPDDEYVSGEWFVRLVRPWAEIGGAAEWNNSNLPRYGFLTSKGAMIIEDNGMALIFSKTNNGNLALTYHIVPNRLASSYAIAADGDTVRPPAASLSEISASEIAFCDGASNHILAGSATQPISVQTVLAPLTTYRTDTASYLSGVYCMPMSQFRGQGIIEVNNVRYATNGYFALQE